MSIRIVVVAPFLVVLRDAIELAHRGSGVLGAPSES